MERAVFYDESGQRRKWSVRIVGLLLALIVAAAIGFALTVIAVPVPRPIYPLGERSQARPIAVQVATLRRNLGAWLPRARAGANTIKQVSVGFYVPWDPDSKASLARHIGQLDWVVPTLASVTGGGSIMHYAPDRQFERIIAASANRPRILPMIQNAANDTWDGAGMAAILHSPARRKALLAWTSMIVTREGGIGAVFDLEELPPSASPDYLRFLAEAHAAFAKRGWLVTLALPVEDHAFNLAAFGKVADRVFLMNYDEHSPGYEAGPIASQGWFVANLNHALGQMPPGKAILAIGNYAYDWHGPNASNRAADSLSDEEAWLAANDSDAEVRFDKASGNATFQYEDNGEVHTVWMLDAASAWNELRAAELSGVAGVALWRLGSEDPGYWNALGRFESGKLPDLSNLHPVGNVDVEGNGELLRIAATPRDGVREVTNDKRGLIRDEHFVHLPTPFVVRRGGDRPGMVAITFDDGPDPVWTPKILDILEAKKVPATFFVIGENAVTQPGLLNRILAGGSELGNHSYTHPNMAHVSDTGIQFELNTTQRLIEAYTGHSMRLFRAPYFGDAEPTTTDELIPALDAQQRGYLNVGLHVDPDDWQRPGVDAIVRSALAQVAKNSAEKSQQIMLLHDGGGDRSQTVAALPAIIDGLRARGITLVPVSTLAGMPHQAINPEVKGFDLLQVRADIGVFLVIAGVLVVIKWLFFVAIAVGVARAVLMAALAVRSRYDGKAPVPPPIDPERFVSVLIPAFNEAKVITGSIARVLASTEVRIEVIVIDDGSTDGTSAAVTAAYADEPRVRLLTLANGGKARALNRGMALAQGDVIIALDADTQFETTTIARLARWFADPAMGAVAGNAKVGNRINLVTRWQAVEYVTAQNLERRALARFDAMTVVPGAVGAWRRAALDAVAWTEAPETFRALAKQRFRWAFGTLQCLWKHWAVLKTGKPAGLALVGLPQAWLFQIGFAVISPIIDLALVISIIDAAVRVAQHGWAQTQSDVLRMAVYWLAFTSIDIASGAIAYWLEPREKSYPAHLLVAQRFIYRQLMYWVVIRAVAAALRGPAVGWGKLERTGSVGAVSS